MLIAKLYETSKIRLNGYPSVDWLPADLGIIERIEKSLEDE